MTPAQIPPKETQNPTLRTRIPATTGGTAACTRYRPLFDILLSPGTPEGIPAGLRAAGALVCSACPVAVHCGFRMEMEAGAW